jgi:hypothetical protein
MRIISVFAPPALEEIKRGGERVTDRLLEETARGIAETEKFLKPD